MKIKQLLSGPHEGRGESISTPPNCRHLMPTGVTCHSPAMRNSAYCYHHDRLHRFPNRRLLLKRRIEIPTLDNRHAVQVGLTNVLGALVSSQLDPRRAGCLLHGLEIASQTLERAPVAPPVTPPASPASPLRPAGGTPSESSTRHVRSPQPPTPESQTFPPMPLPNRQLAEQTV